jgi:hypothetical protein
MKRTLRTLAWLCAGFFLLLAGPLFLATTGSLQGAESWQTASRDSTGIAPRPEQVKEAIVQVYGLEIALPGNAIGKDYLGEQPEPGCRPVMRLPCSGPSD